MPGAVILGAGPGVGRSVALRFAREGLPIALVARGAARIERIAEEVAQFGVPAFSLTADCADEEALRSAMNAVQDRLGTPDVLVYNAAVIQSDTADRLPMDAHLEAWAVNVIGALTAATSVAPAMARRGRGSVIVTGGMPEPKREYVSLSLGKAGLRTLVDLLHLEYGASGVHVASVTIDGPVAPGTAFDPDDIAEHYWTLYAQPPEQWLRDMLHTRREVVGGGP